MFITLVKPWHHARWKTDEKGITNYRIVSLLNFQFEECDKMNDINVINGLINLMNIFDRVDWNFILYVFKRFENGRKFISMIKFVYTSISSKSKINGLLFYSFTLMRGVHQGLPLSILLYVIVVNLLANFIDADEII